ncbi:hypothetical protein [Streptomyces sp. NRRL F-2747]|uniref:hypothetical protein n=1 Tax=Streptomyces sp. NRRL F-2747 TaxID=1463843 RepID=UPI00131BD25E|nr:hypothetical protein [Streptomyces sp. NRRL F-2747]
MTLTALASGALYRAVRRDGCRLRRPAQDAGSATTPLMNLLHAPAGRWLCSQPAAGQALEKVPDLRVGQGAGDIC